MKKIQYFFIFIFLTKFGYSQDKLSKIDSVNISSADLIAQNLLKNDIKKSDYMLLNIADEILLICEKKNFYQVFTGRIDFNFDTQKINIKSIKIQNLNKKNSTLLKVFNDKICNPQFFYFTKDKMITSLGEKYIYFVLKEVGVKKFEFDIPVNNTVKHSSNSVFPLQKSIFRYLVKLMNYPQKFRKS